MAAVFGVGMVLFWRSKKKPFLDRIITVEGELKSAKETIIELGDELRATLSNQADVVKESRKDAVKRSKSVISGKVKETFAPYLPDFPYNPKDCRFLGTPNDFIVFDGMDEGHIENVIILEIKSGKSSLSTRQRDLRDAVQEGRVIWEEMKV